MHFKDILASRDLHQYVDCSTHTIGVAIPWTLSRTSDLVVNYARISTIQKCHTLIMAKVNNVMNLAGIAEYVKIKLSLSTGMHSHLHARTQARTQARTHAGTHARTHARQIGPYIHSVLTFCLYIDIFSMKITFDYVHDSIHYDSQLRLS